MRPGPDPLQRLAQLRRDGLTAAVDLPARAVDDDDQIAASPPDTTVATAGLMPDAGDVRLDAGSEKRHFPPVSRVPGRHRHLREGAPARVEFGEMPASEGDVQCEEPLSGLGGWVPDDDRSEWEGFDSLEPGVRHPFQPERRTLPRHRAATGDDVVVDERGRADGNSCVDLDRTDDSERDDSEGDGGIHSDFDRSDSDRADSDGDDSDGDDSDGQVRDGDGGDGDELADSDESDAPQIRAKRLGNRPWGRLAELWVPESLRDARIDPGRRGLLVLLLVAAVAAVATAIGVWRDRPEPRPVETVALAPASGVTGLAALAPVGNPVESAISGAASTSGTAPVSFTAAANASTAPPTEIVVSVTGLVAHPGVVTLPAGARVTDAITAAGGSTATADLTGLNLAAKLVDGDSVVIAAAAAGAGNSGVSSVGSAHSPSPGNQGASSGQPASSQLIDLNTADEAALDSLPGVGPVMAQNILAWRQQNGRFSSVEQLQEISGIGPARYAQISALVTVS